MRKKNDKFKVGDIVVVIGGSNWSHKNLDRINSIGVIHYVAKYSPCVDLLFNDGRLAPYHIDSITRPTPLQKQLHKWKNKDKLLTKVRSKG